MGEPATRFSPEDMLNRLPTEIRLMDRKYGVLAVMDDFGRMPKNLVVKLGESLARNPESSIRDILCAMQGKKKTNWINDTPLDHVSLFFTPEELSRTYTSATEIPPFLVDVLAGQGPARPLLKALYSLESLGLVDSKKVDGEETFNITPRGHERAVGQTHTLYSLNYRGLLFQLGPNRVNQFVSKKPLAA